MKHGEAFLLVYACDSRASFAEIHDFYHGIVQHRREEAEDELYSDSDEDERGIVIPPRGAQQQPGEVQQQPPLAPNQIPPMVMVCNKIDLPSESRVISREEGERLAQQLGIAYIEASAQEDINCIEVFATLVRMTLERRENQKDKKVSRPSRFWCTIL